VTLEPDPDERRERSLRGAVLATVWAGTILVYVLVKGWLDHGGVP